MTLSASVRKQNAIEEVSKSGIAVFKIRIAFQKPTLGLRVKRRKKMQNYIYYTICEKPNKSYRYILMYGNGDIELLNEVYFEKGGLPPEKCTKDYTSYFIETFSKKVLEKLLHIYQIESHPSWYQVSDTLKVMVDVGWIRKKTLSEIAQELGISDVILGLCQKSYITRVVTCETSRPSFFINLVGYEANRSPNIALEYPYKVLQMSYTSRPLKVSFAKSLEALKKTYQVVVKSPYNVKGGKKCTG